MFVKKRKIASMRFETKKTHVGPMRTVTSAQLSLVYCASATALLFLHTVPHHGSRASGVHAFVATSSLSRSRFSFSTTEQGTSRSDNDENEDEIDVEDVRKRLEALLGDADDNVGKKGKGKKLADYPRTIQQQIIPAVIDKLRKFVIDSTEDERRLQQPALTSIGRERRSMEVTLLSSLEKSDKAVPKLWALWRMERGPDAASELLKAENLAHRGPVHWDEAERMLWNLIQDHGIYWAEPVNQLATLMYTRGRFEDSRTLCEVVLLVKPWHFGALSGIVMVYSGLGDRVNAQLWADRRLPPIKPTGGNDRRQQWVQRALSDAVKTLKPSQSRLDYNSADDDMGRWPIDGMDDCWQ